MSARYFSHREISEIFHLTDSFFPTSLEIYTQTQIVNEIENDLQIIDGFNLIFIT